MFDDSNVLHWSCAKLNWIYNSSHTRNLTHSPKQQQDIGVLCCRAKIFIRVWGVGASRLEAAVPVKTHSGGTAHLGGHASHANLPLSSQWGRAKNRQLPNDPQLLNKHIFTLHTLTPIHITHISYFCIDKTF